jgi:hypothetical protein
VRELINFAKDATAYFDLLPLAKAVEAHYAPPFKIQGPGVYVDKCGNEWIVFRDRKGWLGLPEDRKLEIFDESGKSGVWQLTKYLRPLEG